MKKLLNVILILVIAGVGYMVYDARRDVAALTHEIEQIKSVGHIELKRFNNNFEKAVGVAVKFEEELPLVKTELENLNDRLAELPLVRAELRGLNKRLDALGKTFGVPIPDDGK